jgi:transposase
VLDPPTALSGSDAATQCNNLATGDPRRPGHEWCRKIHNSLIEFLAELHQLLDGRKVTLIWDGLPSHRSKKMTAWIAEQRSWLRVERLPGYANELNPVEGVWGNLKASELANLCPDTVEQIEQAADDGLCRIGTNTDLCHAFMHQTPLRL